MTGQGVGASVPRKEDERLMRGRGQFVADLRASPACVTWPLCAVRSHTDGFGTWSSRLQQGRAVFVAADLRAVKPIRAVSGVRGFKVSDQPVLAVDKVRYVGEPVAMCLAANRAEAEDLVAAVRLDIEELPAVHDMLAARQPGSALLHDHWGDNIFLETFVDLNFEKALSAPIRVTREIRNRAAMYGTHRRPRHVVAGLGCSRPRAQLARRFLSACQMPHIVRTGLADCLGLDEGRVRVIAPDVGGGFGYKGILLAEEVCLGWLAMRCGHPVRWIEDPARAPRQPARIAASITIGSLDMPTAMAVLLASIARRPSILGAYSAYPFSACLEAAQVASILPGPYDFPAYRCRTYSAATNKCPILPYRGVARTGVCFALELVLDAIAREAGVEPHAVRAKILVPSDKMPFTNITNKWFDSGDYPESLRRAVAAINVQAVRERQKHGEPDGRLIGVGLATYCEQAAHGTSVYYGWGIPMVPGFEQATARLTPDGGLELRVGIQSHGQGLETTLAQVAHEILGIDIAKIKVVHGDTAMTPYSTGTWGSRCMVMAGGAVSVACKEIGKRAAKIGAQLLQTGRQQQGQAAGWRNCGPCTVAISLTSARNRSDLVSQAAELTERRVDMGGLEATIGYSGRRPIAAHSVMRLTPCWLLSIRKLVMSKSSITWSLRTAASWSIRWSSMARSMVGLLRVLARPFTKKMPFDSAGQPLASTFADYIAAGPNGGPVRSRIEHMETLSPHTEFGVKGIGEGGAIVPPAAIARTPSTMPCGRSAPSYWSRRSPRGAYFLEIARAGRSAT